MDARDGKGVAARLLKRQAIALEEIFEEGIVLLRISVADALRERSLIKHLLCQVYFIYYSESATSLITYASAKISLPWLPEEAEWGASVMVCGANVICSPLWASAFTGGHLKSGRACMKGWMRGALSPPSGSRRAFRCSYLQPVMPGEEPLEAVRLGGVLGQPLLPFGLFSSTIEFL